MINLNKVYELGIDNSNAEHMERAGYWHPSSCGYCPRAQVWQKLLVQPTNRHKKRLKEIFELGHVVHDIVQSRFEKLGPHLQKEGLHYEFQREVKFDPENDMLWLDHEIGGTADGILRIWNSQFEQRFLIEIKTMNDDQFEKMQKLKKAKHVHLLQSHLYAFRFDLPLILVLYVNKNNCKREAVLVPFDRNIFIEALRYFSRLNDHVQWGTLPDREESWFECSECRYRDLCRPKVLNKENKAPLAVPSPLRRK